MRRVGRGPGPNVANKDSPAVQSILAIELTPAVFELADIWRQTERAILAICPIETPLMGLGIVQTKSQAFDVAIGTADVEFLQLGAPVPDLASNGSTVKLSPRGRTAERMEKALQMDLPTAKLKIKIVAAIAGGGFCRFRGLRAGVGLSAPGLARESRPQEKRKQKIGMKPERNHMWSSFVCRRCKRLAGIATKFLLAPTMRRFVVSCKHHFLCQ